MPFHLVHEQIAVQHKRNPQELAASFQDPDTINVPAFTNHVITKSVGLASTIPVTIYSDCTPCRAKLRRTPSKHKFLSIHWQVKLHVMCALQGQLPCWVFQCNVGNHKALGVHSVEEYVVPVRVSWRLHDESDLRCPHLDLERRRTVTSMCSIPVSSCRSDS